MTNTAALTQFYEQEIRPIVAELEQRRVNVRKRAIISAVIIFPSALLLALLLGRLIGEFGFIIPFGIALAGWGYYNNAARQEYRSYFKGNVIARLARLVDKSLVYQAGVGIGQSEFRASGIYRQGIDRYSAEDRFSGKIGATDFRFSEIHAEYKTTSTDSKGNTTTNWHTIFRGIFFIADFNKHFQGQTYVLPDAAENLLGGLGRMMQGLGSKMSGRPGELVRLEDPEFERVFVVHSTDQVEARYILSTSLMQRLTQFSRDLGTPVSLAFVNAQIYIAISTNRNYFEPPSLWRGAAILKQEDVEAYFKDVRLAAQIIEDLNLNLRIWSKQ